jgi:hypothetical protein
MKVSNLQAQHTPAWQHPLSLERTALLQLPQPLPQLWLLRSLGVHHMSAGVLCLLVAVLQEVAEQLRGLLPAADCHTDQPAAGEAAGSNGTAVGAGSSRFRITCHPQVPAVILQGSGPQPVDLSAGELYSQLGQVLSTDNNRQLG